MEKNPLTDLEIKRLEDMISSIAKFNYLNFIIAGISLILSTLDSVVLFSLPIGNLVIPYKTTMIGFYILSVSLTMVTLKLIILALPAIKVDNSRITLPWIGLSNGDVKTYSIYFWIIIPMIINCIPLAINYPQLKTGNLLFGGLFLVMTPTAMENYLDYLINKKDDKADLTFSMWILYLIRLSRGLIIPLYFLSAILLEISKWRAVGEILMKISVIAIVIIYLLRIIGPITYKFFDKIGTKLGFSALYPYKINSK